MHLYGDRTLSSQNVFDRYPCTRVFVKFRYEYLFSLKFPKHYCYRINKFNKAVIMQNPSLHCTRPVGKCYE